MATAIQSLVHFCRDINVGVGKDDQCLLKAIICNMQYIHRQALYAKLFGESSYANWEMIDNTQKRMQSRKKGNMLGNCITWFYLLSFIRANKQVLQTQAPSAKTVFRPFYLVHDAITNEFKRTGTVIDLSTIVQVFFVCNIVGILPVVAIETVLDKTLKRPVKSEAQNIMIQIASEKFTPEQYASTISWLVSSSLLFVNTQSLDTEVGFQKQISQNSKDIMKVYNIQVQKSGRPSLTSIARMAQKNNISLSASSPNTIGYNDYYKFQGFTYRMRFPNSLSIDMQKRAYWLSSQRESFGWRDYAHDFLPKDLATALLEYGDVQNPEPLVIADVLNQTVIVGAPFPALQSFQNTCLVSLPAIERMGISMNEVFRLYVASYQHRVVWKEVWKLIKPVLSTQIIKDVEVFTNSHDMDCLSVSSVILYGYSKPPLGTTIKGCRITHNHPSSNQAPTSSQYGSLGVSRRSSFSSSGCSETNDGGVQAGEGGSHCSTIYPSDSASVYEHFHLDHQDTVAQAMYYNRQSAASIAANKVQDMRRKRRTETYVMENPILILPHQPLVVDHPPLTPISPHLPPPPVDHPPMTPISPSCSIQSSCDHTTEDNTTEDNSTEIWNDHEVEDTDEAENCPHECTVFLPHAFQVPPQQTDNIHHFLECSYPDEEEPDQSSSALSGFEE